MPPVRRSKPRPTSTGGTDMAFAFEHEESWHPDDPVRELARNLAPRIALVDGLQEPLGMFARSLLAAVAHRYELAIHRAGLDERARLRLEQLAIDLDYARSRL